MRLSITPTTEFETYLLEAIDGDPYEELFDDDNHRLIFLFKIFNSEYGHNIKRIKSLANAFAEYLSGLPSICGVAFANSDILDLAKNFEEFAGFDEDSILEKWFRICAEKYVDMFRAVS